MRKKFRLEITLRPQENPPDDFEACLSFTDEEAALSPQDLLANQIQYTQALNEPTATISTVTTAVFMRQPGTLNYTTDAMAICDDVCLLRGMSLSVADAAVEHIDRVVVRFSETQGVVCGIDDGTILQE